MVVKILGYGELGKAFHKLFPQATIITENNLEEINNSIVINCTPASALPEISKYTPKHIINCCKGMIDNKTASDFFENISSIGGYYKANIITENLLLRVSREIPDEILNYLKQYITIVRINNSAKEVEMAGVIKNVLLLFNTQFSQDAFIHDYNGCIFNGSRNQKFSQLFFNDKKSVKEIEKDLGLIEGISISKQVLSDRCIKW